MFLPRGVARAAVGRDRAVGSSDLLPLEAERKEDCSSTLDVGSSWLPTEWSRAKPSCAGASSCSIFINICERGGKQCYCATNQTGNYVICLNCVSEQENHKELWMGIWQKRPASWQRAARFALPSLSQPLLEACRAACPSFSHYFRGLQRHLRRINHRYFAHSKCVLQKNVWELVRTLGSCCPKQGGLWVQQEGATGGELCFGVEEPRVMLWFLKKSSCRNTGAPHGDLCHWAGVAVASVAQPASPMVPGHCNDDGYPSPALPNR